MSGRKGHMQIFCEDNDPRFNLKQGTKVKNCQSFASGVDGGGYFLSKARI